MSAPAVPVPAAAKPRPLPEPSAWSAPYWEAAREERFVLQVCRDCDKPIMYPKRFCPVCLGENLGWDASAGTGEIYSFTVQQAGPPSGFEALVPYVLAIVRLDEGVQLMANVVGDDAQDVACGDRVSVDFVALGDEVTLPVFRRVLEPADGGAVA